MSESISETIVVELDSILDTRLGVVHLQDPALATKLVESGIWHGRDTDQLPGVDYPAFKERYARRDEDVLKVSSVTGILPFLLKKLVVLLNEEALATPGSKGVKILVNLYPYELVEDVRDSIAVSVSGWVDHLATVEAVRMSPAELTPDFCIQSNVKTIALYNSAEWLDSQTDNFTRQKLLDVTVYTAAMYHVKKPSEVELKQLNDQGLNPLRALKFAGSMMLDLQPIDAKYFSVVKPE